MTTPSEHTPKKHALKKTAQSLIPFFYSFSFPLNMSKISQISLPQINGILFISIFLASFSFTLLLEDQALAQVTGQPGVGQNFSSGLGYRPKPLKRLRKDSGNGRFIKRTANEVYGTISKVETRLYGKTYWEEALNKRFKRVEKTLFGSSNKGDLEDRLIAIEENLKISKRPNAQYDHHKPMLQYLEKKIFQRNFPDWPITERIGQLESHVFGKSFYEYPVDVRIKKLTYTIPILAKEIRVSNAGSTLASTQSKASKAPTAIGTNASKTKQTTTEEIEIKGTSASPPPKPLGLKPSGKTPKASPIHQLSPTYSTPQKNIKTPSGKAILTGNYLGSTYRTSQGLFLRWMNLPVKVHSKNASVKEELITKEALQLWRRHFPIESVKSAYEADILIEWNRKPASKNPITRPILHLDNKKSIRTLILIDMTPYKELPKLPAGPPLDTLLLHGMLHQLGHAAGLWGHSNNPHDIMYPVNGLESFDILKRWNRRSPRQSTLEARGQHFLPSPEPSPRDFSTLTRIYSKPGKDLKTYSPYH